MALDYNEITRYLSNARLQSYEQVCHNDNNKTIKLYQANLRLSQAFYPLLSLYEVILRNAINQEIATFFADNSWLITQQTGFMNHPSLTYRDRRTGVVKNNHFLKNSVAKSIADAGGTSTQGKIMADLNFGFWTALFDNTHYRLLAGCPIRIFTNLPAGANRNLIHQQLNRLRDFRNRVYHNEPIIFVKDATGNFTFNLQPAENIYAEIQDFFKWLNLDFNQWTKHINNITLEIERTKCLMAKYPKAQYYFNRITIGIKHYKTKYL